MGVDMASRQELIAANKSVDEIAAHIGADSLKYLSMEGLGRAIGGPTAGLPLRGHCMACFSGDYPLDLDGEVSKFALEG